ncbi:MAG: M20/M25/M40 family metallo-hydrolase, partial [Clostridia bacterium]|nr:M20/M25/M40 family metallo-hydrolase [Clostridia bacterium]
MLDNNELALELKKIIDCETISEIGVSHSEKYEKCYEVMRELFPNFFGAVSVANADGNLLMKWKGNDSSLEPILLMNHYDVVSAEGEWKHPPFQAEIENERLYGRGTLDTKGGLYCMLKAAEELIKEALKEAIYNNVR